jgi:hypothetical protein
MKAEWKLKSISINFREGFSLSKDEEKRHDRYEGKIVFENDEEESFSMRVKPDMSQKYIDLIAADIVEAATGLGERIKESIVRQNP